MALWPLKTVAEVTTQKYAVKSLLKMYMSHLTTFFLNLTKGEVMPTISNRHLLAFLIIGLRPDLMFTSVLGNWYCLLVNVYYHSMYTY